MGAVTPRYSQSVKKTWAALYLEVGGSLKSLMREWMDCKREGTAGLGRVAPQVSQQGHPRPPLLPQAPLDHCPSSTGGLAGAKMPSQGGHPSTSPQPKAVPPHCVFTFSEGVMR